ncbi:MAG: hypothetical protein ACKV2T_07625 [Kofleriaceae bacterium]
MQFPAFLFGDEQSIVDAAEAAGLAWAERYRRTRAFAPDSLRPIAPGELVVVHDGTLDPFTPRWRVFGASFALIAGELSLPAEDRESFAAAARATPWAALAGCIRHRPPNTIAAVSTRARAVFAAWPELATLRYIGAARRMPSVIQFPEPEPVSIGLDALLNQLFSGPLAVWGPQLGSARLRLEHALDAMAGASLDEAREKVAARMASLARENLRTRGTRAEDPERIAQALYSLPPDDVAALVPCVTHDLLSVLYGLLEDNTRAANGAR